MINFIKEQLIIRKLKKGFREYTQPDRAFLKSAKLRFVTMVQQKSGVSVQVKHSHSWKYVTVAVVVIFSMTSGMIVFADVNNVSATNPLYNFKRVSEQIRMGLSSPTQQVKLHQVFAHRRLDEVVELEVKLETEGIKKEDKNNPQTPPQSQDRINKLNEDFENEAETGLIKVQDTNVKKEVRQKFCQEILDTINNRANKRQNPAVERVKVKCVEEENKIEQENKEDRKEDRKNRGKLED